MIYICIVNNVIMFCFTSIVKKKWMWFITIIWMIKYVVWILFLRLLRHVLWTFSKSKMKRGRCFHKPEYSLEDGKTCFISSGKWFWIRFLNRGWSCFEKNIVYSWCMLGILSLCWWLRNVLLIVLICVMSKQWYYVVWLWLDLSHDVGRNLR